MNTSAPSNIDPPIAQPAMELNWDVGGMIFANACDASLLLI
jgi:hypothetical protein